MANDLLPLQRLLCFIFIFASLNRSITVASHNLHSFKKSSVFHKQCIEQYGGLWLGQELWLPESRLSQLQELGVNYVAHSGMEDAISNGILRGRPFGGVSIAWAPDLNHVIKPLVNYRHKRIVCVEAALEPDPVLFVSLYMLFFDACKRQECMAESIETISMLEEILSDHPLHKVIIGGDYNTEFRNSSPFDRLWSEFMSKYNLISCDNQISDQNSHTYFHDSLNQRKWNDHFLISQSLVASTGNHVILDVGDNPSDHHPIMFELSMRLPVEPPEAETSTVQPLLKWEKSSAEQTDLYSNCLSSLLNVTPSVVTTCGIAHCTNEQCIKSIQDEYDILTDTIKNADKALPRHKPGVQKHWWTEELSSLKERNISIHNIWKSEGKPRSGHTNEERLRVRATYRHAIKSAQKKPIQSCWNKLHTSLASKNTTEFWKSWKRIYNSNQSDLHTVVNGLTSKEEISESFKSHFVKVSQPNNRQRVNELKNTFEDKYKEEVTNHHNCSCNAHSVTTENVVDAILSLKKGKCSDDQSISAEHFFHAPLPMIHRLKNLFNAMLLHGHVPKQFQRGTIVPIVKDNQGDKSDLNNYRGITIAPIISKVFEHVLRILFQPYLTTSSYQFGFKRKSSTSLAERTSSLFFCAERGLGRIIIGLFFNNV